MKFNCIAVDDDPANLELLSDYLDSLGNYRLVKSFTDPIKAMSQIGTDDNLDIVFMDIEMPRMSGLELARIIRPLTKSIVFTTAHSKYAIDAFDTEADAFLLKPYSLSRFASAMHRLQKRNTAATRDAAGEEPYFFIKSKNDKSKLVKIRFDEIVAIESTQNYVSIYTVDKTIVAHITLTRIKEILRHKDNFLQIHRTFIISRNHLEEVENNLLRMKNGLLLTIGENYREELIDFIKKRTIRTGRN